MNGRAAQKAEDIQLVALDVDGVLTDGSVLYGASDQARDQILQYQGRIGHQTAAKQWDRGRHHHGQDLCSR